MKGRVHGLYGIADVSGAPGRTEFEVAEAFLGAGVSVLQLRMKGAPEAAIAAVLEALVPRCADAGCSLLVNDHVGLAARFGIGVHLGQEDANPAGARDAVGPDVLVGWSTHDARDVERAARESPFGTTIAHGFLVLSVIGALKSSSEVRIVGMGSVINYGADKLRFVSPVPAGSVLHARRRIAHVRKKGHGTQVTFEIAVHVVGQERPAMLYRSLVLFVP